MTSEASRAELLLQLWACGAAQLQRLQRLTLTMLILSFAFRTGRKESIGAKGCEQIRGRSRLLDEHRVDKVPKGGQNDSPGD